METITPEVAKARRIAALAEKILLTIPIDQNHSDVTKAAFARAKLFDGFAVAREERALTESGTIAHGDF